MSKRKKRAVLKELERRFDVEHAKRTGQFVRKVPQRAGGREFAIGTIAGTPLNGRENSTLVMSVAGKRYPNSHLVWLLNNGDLPASRIDHIDGNQYNNAPENLREMGANKFETPANVTAWKPPQQDTITFDGVWAENVFEPKTVEIKPAERQEVSVTKFEMGEDDFFTVYNVVVEAKFRDVTEAAAFVAEMEERRNG